jgi:surface polysaccharide O-acyltransferase-like enzyme
MSISQRNRYNNWYKDKGFMPTQRPLSWQDIARIGGAAAVVLIHVAAPVVVGFGSINSSLWWIGNVLDSASRWSVPLFVMISGSFLLDPRVPRPIPSFLKRRLMRTAAPLLFWAALYFGWLAWWDGAHVDGQYIATGMLSGIPYSHLYFLFLIIGLYVITPMLRIYVMHASRRNALYCLVVLFAGGIVNTYITTWWNLGGLNAVSQFLPYIGYYMAGYYLKDVVLNNRARTLSGLGVAMLILVTAAGTYGLIRAYGISKGLYLYEYLSPVIVTMTLLLYVWLNSRLQGIRSRHIHRFAQSAIRVLSGATFGIYLVHPLILEVLYRFGLGSLTHPPYGLAATYVVTVTLAAAVIVLLQRVPGLRRLVP